MSGDDHWDNPIQDSPETWALLSSFPHWYLNTLLSTPHVDDGDQEQAGETLPTVHEELEGEAAISIHEDRLTENNRLPLAGSILGRTTLSHSEVEPIQRPTNVSSCYTLRPLKLLSLDGGGYRGLALLHMLRQIMRNIPGIDPSEKLYAHKYFDLIGGTSTGGLVAIMLGRLGMDIEAAIEKYQELGPTIFGEDRGTFLGVVVQGAHFDCKPFDDVLAKWVEDQPMLDPDVDQHCRCFVTTVPGRLAAVITPTIIRSYPDPPRSTVFSHQWLIREAARATSAAPTYFPPLNLGSGYTFVDAGAFGFNNPTSLVLKEAEQIPEFFGRSIGCVVSIGTGLASLARAVGPSNLNPTTDPDITTQHIIQRTIQNARRLFRTPSEAYDRLKRLRDDLIATATNTEATHHSVFWDLRGRRPEVTYIRLNPVGGLATIDLAQFTRGADIEAITNQYLEIPEVADQVVNFAASIQPVSATSDPLCNLEADLPPKVVQSLKKDTAFNMLSGDPITGFAVVLPEFSKGLSASGLKIQLHSTTRFGSCAFDLAETLGLVSNESNKILCEVGTIPLGDLVHNGVTYCARISRHFFVWLISEHVQEIWQDGDRTFVSTNIGQFMLYPHEGRSLVHFDRSIRTSTREVIANQALEDILVETNGEYNGESGTRRKLSINVLAIKFVPIPFVVRYLRTKDIEEWRLLEKFAGVLAEVVKSVAQAATAPESFAAAFATNWCTDGAMSRVSSVVERLAVSMQKVTLLFKMRTALLETRNFGLQVAHRCIWYATSSHEIFRSRPVDRLTFLLRSADRLDTLFELYREDPDRERLRQELLKLLNPRAENIALVIALAALALTVKCNAGVVLNTAREAPEEWMRFVSAEDGDMFIGAEVY